MILLTCVFLLTECIPCYHTSNGPAVETCEINPDEDQYCTINCDRVSASIAHCSLDCHINSFFPCNNMTTPDYFELCCTTPYCNNITSVFFPTSFTPSPTSFTPSPTSSKLVTLLSTEYMSCVMFGLQVQLGPTKTLLMMFIFTLLLQCVW